MAEDITEIQKKILEYIIDCKATKGLTPTLAEIALYFNYKNRSTVQQHLEALEKKGYIKRNAKLARNIEIVGEEAGVMYRKVLGEVAAGSPLAIYPDAVDSLELPSVLMLPKNTFLLRVRGDSMKDVYIFDGDLVIVNPLLLPPRNGQIVVAILENAAVVKRCFLKNDIVELHSENPEYKPIIARIDEVRFAGVVVGMYRTMSNV